MSSRRRGWSGAVRAGAGVMLMLGAVACSDRADVSAPEVPVLSAAQPGVLGMVDGEVDANGKVTFTPAGVPGARLAPGVNASVYGTQGVNVLLYATPTVITTAGRKTTWTFNVGIENYLSYPIGANQGGLAPFDTLGLYVAIIDGPTPVTGSCIVPSQCPVTFNASGTGTFTAANQPYVYWHDRLTAFGGGKDTTTDRLPFTFTAPAGLVTGFRFTMIVGAAWPPPKQAIWSAYYNAATDSEPDLHGKPPWKKTHMAVLGGSGTDTLGSGALILSGSGGQNIYLFRADSLAAATPAVIEANMQVIKNQSSPEVVFGLADNARKLAMVGLSQNAVGFVRFAPFFVPTWGFISNSLQVPANSSSPHTYQLQKFGTDSVVLSVDGVRALATTYASLPTVPVLLLPATSTAIFGTGSISGPAGSEWFHVTYTIGALTVGPMAP